MDDDDDLDKLPLYRPDATTANADWTKRTWDFPPYRSVEFFEAIGGLEQLDHFKTSPAYTKAVERGLIHDDEWVLDWVTPVMPGEDPGSDEPQEPGKPRRNVHVHVHRPR